MKLFVRRKKFRFLLWLPVPLACRAIAKLTGTQQAGKAWKEVARAVKKCRMKGELFRFERGETVVSVRR